MPRLSTTGGRRPAFGALIIALIACALLLSGCEVEPGPGSSPGSSASTGSQVQAEVSQPFEGETGGQDGAAALAGPEIPGASADAVARYAPEVVAAHNRLGFLLLADLVTGEAGAESKAGRSPANVVLSPLSVALALSMAQSGAEGTTAFAMAQALQLASFLEAGRPREAVDAANLELAQSLREAAAGGEVQLEIASALWHRAGLSLVPGFAGAMRRFYEAEVSGLDFAAPESVDAVNTWVEKATRGLIPRIVDRLSDDLAVLIANAVYFQGDWQTPFDPDLTGPAPFSLLSGAQVNVEMMYRSGSIAYYEADFQAIRLPYGRSGRTAMYVFLPPAGEPIESFAQRFEAAAESAFGRFRPEEGEVWLPRLDAAYQASLKEALGRLGMGIAFDPVAADFGRMIQGAGPGDAFIGDVLHQAVLKVDEAGTEAAAVTSVEVRLTSLPVRRFSFRADRPFLFVIRDDESGMILFAGAIVDPNGA